MRPAAATLVALRRVDLLLIALAATQAALALSAGRALPQVMARVPSRPALPPANHSILATTTEV
jgi:hypothetical protein